MESRNINSSKFSFSIKNYISPFRGIFIIGRARRIKIELKKNKR